MVNGFMSYNASRLSGWSRLECMLRNGVMFVVTLPEKRGVSNVISVVVAVFSISIHFILTEFSGS